MDKEWSLDAQLIHLNHAAIGPWPVRTREAVIDFAQQNTSIGSLYYPQWLKIETDLKLKLARLINTESVDSIALLKNTSEGLSLIASGIDWQSGDQILTSNEEFPSNRIVWQSLEKKGVELKQVDLSSAESAETALIDAMTPKTRMLAISSVQYASGLRIDINLLGEVCRERNILFCIDAIQQLGALDFNVQQNHADFVVADGHKWMLGPEGVALFYCRKEAMEQLTLSQFGWHMVENAGDYSSQTWQVAQSARRFECGSPNMLGIHALNASLSLILELGIDKIEKSILSKTNKLIELVNSHSQLKLLSNARQDKRSGIVTFCAPTHDSNVIYTSLMSRNILCANRGGGIRFSPHYYTPDQDLESAVLAVIELVQ